MRLLTRRTENTPAGCGPQHCPHAFSAPFGEPPLLRFALEHNRHARVQPAQIVGGIRYNDHVVAFTVAPRLDASNADWLASLRDT
jgi:hypothetical protein